MISRRDLLFVAGAGATSIAGTPRPATAQPTVPTAAANASPPPAPPHADFGPILPPLPAPRLKMITHGGQATDLRRLLDGRVCALQLMFTSCSATCPIQGAVFADAAKRLASAGLEARAVRLLSFSIDPLGDTPQALSTWMRQHGPSPLWHAAVPVHPDGGQQMLEFLRAGRPGPDPHTGQVHVFDRRGRWIFKSADLPSSREIAHWLTTAARTGG